MTLCKKKKMKIWKMNNKKKNYNKINRKRN